MQDLTFEFKYLNIINSYLDYIICKTTGPQPDRPRVPRQLHRPHPLLLRPRPDGGGVRLCLQRRVIRTGALGRGRRRVQVSGIKGEIVGENGEMG